MEYEEHQKHEILARMLCYLVLPFLSFLFIAIIAILIYTLS
ncbi:hypothetical protein SAMN04488121_10470 [Chitinophaga filiformis]|uniref:Uncharacterized protein n=1 Tax=Chitinophaga filiformis TaxID=104663 RepID=A0A1G7TU86_CHIFI|nr:hypothetical protein SAMN04488121_10470 [Chitinophaga filiformis]